MSIFEKKNYKMSHFYCIYNQGMKKHNFFSSLQLAQNQLLMTWMSQERPVFVVWLT